MREIKKLTQDVSYRITETGVEVFDAAEGAHAFVGNEAFINELMEDHDVTREGAEIYFSKMSDAAKVSFVLAWFMG